MIGARAGTRAGAPALLRPFPGLRYDLAVAGPLGTLLAPPHTELDKVARRAVLAGSRYAVTHLERPEYRGPADPADGPAVLSWLGDGALLQDAPSVYVLSQRAGGLEHRFLLAALTVGPDHDHRTLAHEDTIPEALVSRVARLRATAVDSEPVLVVATSAGSLGNVLSAPERHGHLVVDGSATGVEVRLWRVDDPTVLAELQRSTGDAHLLIADGHHRYAAVRRMAQESGHDEQVLVAVADQATHPVDLVALHRVLPGDHAVDVALAAGRVRRVPEDGARKLAADLTAHEFLVVAGDDAFVVVGDGPDVGGRVDARLSALGVDPGRIRYVADPDEVWRHRSAGTIVLMPRPEIDSVLAWARSGRLMGRKTTSFRPKPLAGAVLRLR